jgi:methionyl-tRNA synthetase
MLKAEGSYILPDNVPANEFLNLEGDKISTSHNWAVWLHKYLEEFPNKQDVLRYVLTANAPETKDNDFTWKDFQARNNNELAAIFGNFVNRIIVLTHKYFDGKAPAQGQLQDIDKDVLKEMLQYPARISESIEQYRFREALAEVMNLARSGNKYLTDTEPWKLIKTDEARTATVLNVSLQIVAHLAVLCEPFMPFTAEKIRAMLGLQDGLKWDDANNETLIMDGTKIAQPALLFDKIEDDMIALQIARLEELKEKKQN